MSSIITRSKLELAPHSSPTRAELFLVKERWSGSPRQRHECHDEVKELVESILPKRTRYVYVAPDYFQSTPVLVLLPL